MPREGNFQTRFQVKTEFHQIRYTMKEIQKGAERESVCLFLFPWSNEHGQS